MAYYVLLDPVQSASQSSGALMSADLQSGSNGSFFWAPELSVSSPDTSASNQLVWDGNLEDGFDSNAVAVRFEANTQLGTGTLDVDADSSATASIEGSGGNYVQQVVISAGTTIPGETRWSDLTVTFYNGENEGESVTVLAGPDAELSGSTGFEQQSLVVQATGTNYDRVVVTGTLRMLASDNIMPNWSDLFADITISAPAS